MPSQPVKLVQQINAWTNQENFVGALKITYSDNTSSDVFGNSTLVSTTEAHSWTRQKDEKITELFVASFQGNITKQIYAIKLKSTKQPDYAVGAVQTGWPLQSIWKSVDQGDNADIGDLPVAQYPTENKKWLVNIKATTTYYVDPVPKQVAGHVVSKPADGPGLSFVVSFDLDQKHYEYTGDHNGIITNEFDGAVTVTYHSTDEFNGPYSFDGTVGGSKFYIEIETGTTNIIKVDGPSITTSQESVPIHGNGSWSPVDI